MKRLIVLLAILVGASVGGPPEATLEDLNAAVSEYNGRIEHLRNKPASQAWFAEIAAAQTAYIERLEEFSAPVDEWETMLATEREFLALVESLAGGADLSQLMPRIIELSERADRERGAVREALRG